MAGKGAFAAHAPPTERLLDPKHISSPRRPRASKPASICGMQQQNAEVGANDAQAGANELHRTSVETLAASVGTKLPRQ